MAEERNTTTPKEREHTDPRKRQPQQREHDQDSEPPRTAVPPDAPENEADWNRQEGC